MAQLNGSNLKGDFGLQAGSQAPPGGYYGVISIEHEDPRYDGEEGTKRSMAGLQRALAQLAVAA